MKPFWIISLSALLLSGCSSQMAYENRFVNEATVTDTTKAGEILENLPAPNQQLAVVVYDFQDQTGQLKENPAFAEYSSAVTKGGLSVLVKALLDTSNGMWFMVAERNALNDLLKERQIIRAMRADYAAPDGSKLGDLPPLIYGGMMIQGGIVFYDSNVLTGGAAAGYFGLNSSTQYNRDMVAVYLRAIDINTGRVILSVNSSKTVFSVAVSAGVTRYLSFDRLLEAETGFTVNEPGQLAVRQAIETAVYSMIMEGTLHNLWGFKDEEAGKKAIAAYMARKSGPHDSNGWMQSPAPSPEHVVSKSHGDSQAVAKAEDNSESKSGVLSWMGL